MENLEIDKSSPVLVSGATGYVAGVLIQQLLNLGLTVHATVRDPSRTNRLQYLMGLANNSPGTIKFFRGNLMEEGSFAEGMKGCSIVFHTASPFKFRVADPQKDLVEPAVRGTRNVLNEATKSGSVKRVVLTSSVAAVYNDSTDTYEVPEHKLTEDHWNTGSTLKYKPYSYSKTKAEQAAWEVAGSQTNWTMVVMNPSMVMGPGITYHGRSESFKMIKRIGGGEMTSGYPNVSLGVVDVRDVAKAHIVAAYSKNSKGRYILCGANTGFKEMGEVIRQKFPDYPIPSRMLPKLVYWSFAPCLGSSRRYAWANTGVPINFDNTKSVRDLGMEYRSLSETLQEMFQQLIDEGVMLKKC